jgi:pSer/pThr/pTyr-binding forkhead associated (FHA) protein
MRASLIPLDGGQTIELVKDVTVIGRKEFCDVRLDDPSVSKVHLLIAKSDGLLLFRDMSSTNGTKVNGQRVIRGMLLPNDKLQIAACRFQVQLLPKDPPQDKPNPSPRIDDAVVRVFKADDLARPGSPDAMKQNVDLVLPREGDDGNADRFVDDPQSSSTPAHDPDSDPIPRQSDNQFVD